jgi:hypothetical protein
MIVSNKISFTSHTAVIISACGHHLYEESSWFLAKNMHGRVTKSSQTMLYILPKMISFQVDCPLETAL